MVRAGDAICSWSVLTCSLDPSLRGVRVGMLSQHRRVQAGKLGARRVHTGAWGQPAEQVRHAVLAVGIHRRPEMVRARHHVRDDLGLGGIGHRRFEDADHGRRS